MLELMQTTLLFEIEQRLVYRNGRWLVRTREIPELGPYDSRLEAVEGLYRHVAVCSGRLTRGEPGLARAFVQHSVARCQEPHCDICADLEALTPDAPRGQLKAAMPV
ncbi:hypothetical protein QQF73_13140 [Marinobacter sp. M216]|uniref:Uncharacterized protein n=1 Tax=Marinobacter albus TaxID=3030833 RepID=A0ABT7HDY8_9GAMM|nr:MULTISPECIES: hypothetical protein [unclassified Marinobacter]MBW7472002.1 hypothetical protein [Marinobacter sp. F4218]MDK9558572.1 hypothetical protein [Marinobacter sp. M216]